MSCWNCKGVSVDKLLCSKCCEKGKNDVNEFIIQLKKKDDIEFLKENVNELYINLDKITISLLKRRIGELQKLKKSKLIEREELLEQNKELESIKAKKISFINKAKQEKSAILKEKESHLNKVLEAIEEKKRAITNLKKKHIANYFSVLKRHDSYTDFSVTEELKIDQEEYFKPCAQNIESFTVSNILSAYEEDEGEKETVVMLLNNISSFNRIHGTIMTEAFTRLADMIFFASKCLGISLPIKMTKKYKNKYTLSAPFSSNSSEFLLNLNMGRSDSVNEDIEKAFTKEDMDTALTMLYMNFLYLSGAVGFDTTSDRKRGRKIMNLVSLIQNIQENLKIYGRFHEKNSRDDQKENVLSQPSVEFFEKTRIVFKENLEQEIEEPQRALETDTSEWEIIE